MTEELKKTPLYQNYIDSGAKIVEFSGCDACSIFKY